MSCSVYKLVYNLYLHNIVRLPWVTRIHNILNKCGFSHVWNDQFVNLDWLKSALKLRLNDQYQQSWDAEVFQSSKCLNYRMYKCTPKLDAYDWKCTFNF